MTDDGATAREANKQTLRRTMNAITAHDIDAVAAELHASVDFVLPFESAVPDGGRDSFLRLLSMMFAMFAKLELTITHIYDLVDPNVLVAQWLVDGIYRHKSVVYENQYIGVMGFRDGKLSSWRGYANPELARAALEKLADDTPAVNT